MTIEEQNDKIIALLEKSNEYAERNLLIAEGVPPEIVAVLPDIEAMKTHRGNLATEKAERKQQLEAAQALVVAAREARKLERDQEK